MQNQNNQIIQVGKIYEIQCRRESKFIGKKGMRECKYYWAKVVRLTGQRVVIKQLNQEFETPTAWEYLNETEFSYGSVHIDEQDGNMCEEQYVSPLTVIREVPRTHRVGLSNFNNTYSSSYRDKHIPEPETMEQMEADRKRINAARFRQFLMSGDADDQEKVIEEEQEPEQVYEGMGDDDEYPNQAEWEDGNNAVLFLEGNEDEQVQEDIE